MVLCVLAADDEDDVALQIHFTLLQAFCCDSGITILRVSGVQRLQQLLGSVDANRNQDDHRDLHCMLVTVSLLRGLLCNSECFSLNFVPAAADMLHHMHDRWCLTTNMNMH